MPPGLRQADRLEIELGPNTRGLLQDVLTSVVTNQLKTIVSEEIKATLRTIDANLTEASSELTNLALSASNRPAVQDDPELKALLDGILQKSEGLRDIVSDATPPSPPLEPAADQAAPEPFSPPEAPAPAPAPEANQV